MQSLHCRHLSNWVLSVNTSSAYRSSSVFLFNHSTTFFLPLRALPYHFKININHSGRFLNLCNTECCSLLQYDFRFLPEAALWFQSIPRFTPAISKSGKRFNIHHLRTGRGVYVQDNITTEPFALCHAARTKAVFRGRCSQKQGFQL